MVTAEHWTNDDGTEHTLIPTTADEATRRAATVGTPRFHCTILGNSWEDCMRRHDRHMGWEEWRPMPEGEDR
jgi:hypothetical protein